MSLSTKALILRKTAPAKGASVYHDVVLEQRPVPALKHGELLLRVSAVAFNRRDLWMRFGMYPRIRFGTVMGSDAAGTVVAAADKADALLGKRVFVVPLQGWDSGPVPVKPIDVVGCATTNPAGIFSQYIVVPREHVLPTPAHLDDVHAAAWPLAAVTAWRACMVNAGVQKGDTVLVTGIGGGVALLAAQLCAARGAHVYVTSSSAEKIAAAVALGAVGGVDYRAADWPARLKAMIKEAGSPGLDAVIDSGGGDVLGMLGAPGLLKFGGKVVCYGMTANPKITMTMRNVMANHQLIGSTMGSREDLADATRFIEAHGLVPTVFRVLDGLESAEEGFELLKSGEQMGKIVMRVRHDANEGKALAKL